jgi:hypothetical protein
VSTDLPRCGCSVVLGTCRALFTCSGRPGCLPARRPLFLALHRTGFLICCTVLQAGTFLDWRQAKQAEQVVARDHQRQLIKSLLPTREVPMVPVTAAATAVPVPTAHKQNEKSAGSRVR